MSTDVIYSLEIIIIFPVSFMIILLGKCFFGEEQNSLREKKQLKVINYEIIPWQCDVRSNYTNYCFHLSFINPLEAFLFPFWETKGTCNGILKGSAWIVYATTIPQLLPHRKSPHRVSSACSHVPHAFL